MALLDAVKCGDKRSLVVYAGDSADTIRKSFSNIPKARYVHVGYLNPLDALWSEVMVLTPEAIEHLN